MKKIYYLLALPLFMMATSCSNEDIDIDITGETHAVTCNINTQKLYEDFGTYTSMRDQILRDGTYEIGVFNYLYNQKGKLVDSDFTHISNFNAVSQTFDKVPEGEYTLVTVETAVRQNASTKEYSSVGFKFVGTETLSTFELEPNKVETFWYSAVGVAYTNVNVRDDMSVTVSPSGIGSIVQLYFTNFANSGYTELAFGAYDYIKSYRMDPSVPQGDRLTLNLSESGKFMSKYTCDVDNDNEIRVTLYMLDTNLNYIFYARKATDEENMFTRVYQNSFTLKYGNRYAVGVNYDATSKTCTGFMGTESEFDNWLKGLTAKAPTLPDLYTEWKGSVSSVQSFMKDYTMTFGKAGEADVQANGIYGLAYSGKSGTKVNSILYAFTSATTGLFEADILYGKNDVTMQSLVNYLNGEYTFVTESDGTYMYLTKDNKSVVMLMAIDPYVYVGFVDYDYVVGQYNAPAMKVSAKAVNSVRNAIKDGGMIKSVVRLGNISNSSSVLEESNKLIEATLF